MSLVSARFLFLVGAAVSVLAQNRAPLAAPGEATIEVGGAKIFYRDTGGNGAPIVLLHAATGTSEVWEKQIPTFRKEGYRVIAFDRRGWGRSTTGPQPGTAADDLLTILNHLSVQKAHIVGTAAGGFVAFDFALSFPDRVRTLVVANSIGGMLDQEAQDLGRRLRPPEFNALPPDLRELGPAFRGAEPAGVARWVQLEKSSRPEGLRTPAQPLKNMMRLAALETIKAPTLLLTGGADMYAPPAVQQQFAAHIKGAQMLVIPDAGHSTYWEQPEAFNKALLAFFKKR